MKSLDIPLQYLNYRTFKPSVRRALEKGSDRCVFRLKVGHVSRYFREKPKRVVIETYDFVGDPVELTFFGPAVFSPEIKDLQPDDHIVVEGVPSSWYEKIQLKNILIIQPEMLGKIIPLYKSKKGMAKRAATISEIQEELQTRVYGITQMILDTSKLTEKQILASIGSNQPRLTDFLWTLHNPSSVEEGDQLRLQANKIAALLIAAQAYRPPRPENSLSAIKIEQSVVDAYISRLPVQLTSDQKTAISEIVDDLRSPKPARRLLSGDVGTGKSYVIAITAVSAREAGARIAIMAPNEPLVQQLGKEIVESFPEVPVVTVTSKSKKLNLQGNPILIGTTSLVHRLKPDQGWIPDYLIVDEQHKQSANARSALLQEHTNLLEATATAIPRTTALACHGDMDLSILRESPVKKKITSHLLGPQDKRRIMECIAKVVENGDQAAIVYPRVNGNDDTNPKSAVMQVFKQWEVFFPGKVVFIHGKMKPDEKLTAIDDFKSNRKSIAVSSTILEVGLTAPNLRVMLIVSPERYGVAQLHQLRGRLSRKGGSGRFFMLLDNSNIGQETVDRLNLIVDYNDGFILSEKDAEMRGFGDLSEDGETQHGDAKGIFQGVRLSPSEVISAIQEYNAIKNI